TSIELRRYDGQGWRAMFFPSSFEHSLTSHVGRAWAPECVGGGAKGGLRRAPPARSRGKPAPRDWTLTDESPAERRMPDLSLRDCVRVTSTQTAGYISANCD